MSDRYNIKERLGEGGFGETFVAIDTETGSEVVVKKLHLKRADDWKAIELFEREAEVLETLDHPRIPKYLDYYEEEEGDGMRLCLVQERAPGVSLEDKVASGWRCDDPGKMLRELLDILIYLQSLRPPIVHRDIKPSNIVVAEDGSISLVDFGSVANVLTDSIGGSTMIGTLGYMAPEQQIGRVEMSTDLFGAAMSVVYAATGDTPEALPRNRLKVDVTEFGFERNLERCLDSMLEPVCEDRVRDAEAAKSKLSKTITVPVPSSTEFKPFRPAEVEKPKLRQWVPLAEFMKAVQPSNHRACGEAESRIAEKGLKGDRSFIVAFDLISILLCIAVFFLSPVYSIIVAAVLVIMSAVQAYTGFSGARALRNWHQSRSLGIDSAVASGASPVTIEDEVLYVGEPALPYALSWGKASIIFITLLTSIALFASLLPDPMALAEHAGLFLLGIYGVLKFMHAIFFSTSSQETYAAIDATNFRAVHTIIPIDELQLWVLESVRVTTSEQGAKSYTPFYTLYGRGRAKEASMLPLGSSLRSIDRRLLEKIDDHVQNMKAKNVAVDFEAPEKQKDEIEREAVVHSNANSK